MAGRERVMAQGEYLYMLRVTRPGVLSEGPTEAEAAARERHFDYVRGLKEAGALILAGRTQAEPERSVGLVIFRADDAEAARAIMEADPAVAEGIMTAELFGFPVAFAGDFTDNS
jgi:uncharacterized protein YciI